LPQGREIARLFSLFSSRWRICGAAPLIFGIVLTKVWAQTAAPFLLVMSMCLIQQFHKFIEVYLQNYRGSKEITFVLTDAIANFQFISIKI
jgi:hypothetical protein